MCPILTTASNERLRQISGNMRMLTDERERLRMHHGFAMGGPCAVAADEYSTTTVAAA